MIHSRLTSSVALAALIVALPLTAGPLPIGAPAVQGQEVRVSFSIFFDELEDHGVWVRHARYKYVWCPNVDVGWRPYTKGRWIYLKDVGWYFDSREPFAWAVYHYGRWTRDRRLGWCWVPGRNWGPAWVSWRRGDDHVGWAPLPPEEDGFQLSVSINIREQDEPEDWFFIPARDFLEPDLSVSIIFGERQPEYLRETRYVGPVIIQNNVVINNVIDIDFIQQETQQEVVVVQATAAAAPTEVAAATPEDGTIEIFAPPLDAPTAEEAPPEAVEEAQAAETLPAPGSDEQIVAEGGTVSEPSADEVTADGTPAAEAAPATGEAAPAEGGAATAEGESAAEGAATAEGAAEAGVATEGEAVTVDGGAAAEADAEVAPTDEAAPVTECPEGEELVDGKCVPIEQPASSTEEPVAAEPAGDAAPAEETAPTEEPAEPPPAEPASEAVPEEAAPEEAAPNEAAPEEAASEEAAPKEEGPAPVDGICPEGYELVEDRCLPLEG